MKTKYLLLLLLLALFPLINLFSPGLPITHDAKDHVARIANFYQNLAEGNLIPRWGENLNWGYGHPVLMFLYPLPSYFASLFHFLGFSFVDSTKLVFASSFILSIVTMFFWLRVHFSEKSAFVGAVLYGFAPYHFVDLYVRGAIGELVAFIFPPLVLLFLYKLSQKNSFGSLLFGSLAMAGFVLAHNAVSLMFLPIIFLYIFYLAWEKKWNRRFLFSSGILLFFGFAVSAFFWLPAFAEGKYTLRDIVTKGSVQNNFVAFTQLLYGEWNYGISKVFTVQIGLLQWLGVLSAVPLLFIKHKQEKPFVFLIVSFIVLFFITLFLMTSASKFVWDEVTLLQKFQFPWRFLSLSMFLAAVIGAFAFSVISKKIEKIFFIIVIIMVLILTKDMWRAMDYAVKPESFYAGVYNGTTDTGESAPIWSVRFMESRPKAQIEVIEGKAQIGQGERMSTFHEYKVIAEEKTRLRENTLYFPGWKVFVDDQPVGVEFQDPNHRGLMTFWVEEGQHRVVVAFAETKLRLLADLVSVVSLVILGVLGILRKRIWQN